VSVTVDYHIIFSGSQVHLIGKMGVGEEELPVGIDKRKRFFFYLAKERNDLFKPFLLSIAIPENCLNRTVKGAQFFSGKGSNKISSVNNQLAVHICKKAYHSLNGIQVIMGIGHYPDHSQASFPSGNLYFTDPPSGCPSGLAALHKNRGCIILAFFCLHLVFCILNKGFLMKRKIAVIAFGGNAILPKDQRGLQSEQMKNAQKAAQLMIHVVKKGYDLIIVHGNGPQVGNILIQMEEAITKIPPFSLEICDAMTEGSMGFMLEKAIINELRKNSLDKEVATLITQVIVDKEDEAFENPTKPIGPFYSKYRAQMLMREKKWDMIEDAGRGFRKVVPSPRPIDVVPKRILHDLIHSGNIVIAAGGGGIPVIITGRGLFQGVEAVIDKDYAASLIAREVKADLFVILTNVKRVSLNFGKPEEEPLQVMDIAEAQQHLDEGQFPPGSMGPKIRAAIEYVQSGGQEVLITSASHLKAALINRAGTKIISAR
jgi:carbamate kinase